MRYVPNLIPEKSKVLPEYFTGKSKYKIKKSPVNVIVFWILSILLLILGLVYFKHLLITLIFGSLGFIINPIGQSYIESSLKFILTPFLKAIVGVFFIVLAISTINFYKNVDYQAELSKKIELEKEIALTELEAKRDQERVDSLNFYIQKSTKLIDEHQFELADIYLISASNFISTTSDESRIKQERINISTIKANDLVKAGKYKTAIGDINRLLVLNPTNAEMRFKRAICYNKIGNVLEAVNDLKSLMDSGHSDAEKLYNKINPLRKKVAYYVTRCCDGTTSGATGRGACSHHRGVCNWNDPVYHEYRKY